MVTPEVDPQAEVEIDTILEPLRQQQPDITCGEAVNQLPTRLRGPFWERAIDRHLSEGLARPDSNGDQP